ncbi:MAG: 4-hydroxythreonine-4-phosphate dehydrogenase PdxA [Chitinophagaceae bacterium]|nr:4-hydroxythreonine-4-phosphate dehydrogenase PdxA [Chitinophagaceae bacterium]
MNTVPNKKPVVGISCGDINGIGPEIIIKALSDSRMTELCTPVVFGSNRLFNFYKKGLSDYSFNYTALKDFNRINQKQVNIFNCWEEEIVIHPGETSAEGGKYAIRSLKAATEAAKNGDVDILVTAPINKKNVYSEDEFPFTGHTPYLKDFFRVEDVVMLMAAGDFRVGLVTEHLPVHEVAGHIDRKGILSKLLLINSSLKKDFNVQRPKIAVLALNPHAGDDGLTGKEEEEIIRPAIKDARQHNIIVEGPFAADGFFARYYHTKFDAVLAMYHDQGLIPFKSLAVQEGINYTAGLDIVRTSPDHGTAMDIAGKGVADAGSLTAAIFEGIDIYRRREFYEDIRKNPLKKRNIDLGVDEKIDG